MAKAKVAMSFTVNLSQTRLNELLDAAVTQITSNFESDEIKKVGLDLTALKLAVAADPQFAKNIQLRLDDAIEHIIDDLQYGDYLDIKILNKTFDIIDRELAACDQAEADKINADRKNQQTANDAQRLKDAIDLLRENGYMI